MTFPQVLQRVLRMGISCAVVWAVIAWAAIAARAMGGEPPFGGAPQTQEPPSPPGAEPPPSDAYKPLGPSLFPLYEHYLRTADGTSVRNIHSTSIRASPTRHHHLD